MLFVSLRSTWRLSLLGFHIFAGTLIVLYQRMVHARYWYNSNRGKRLIQWWMRRACRILAIQVSVDGIVSQHKNTLYVANHISWIDIITLSSVIQAKFISKDTLKYWPVIGWLATSVGTLLIQRGKYFVINHVVSRIRMELQQRHAVLVFPEGTTTDGTGMAPFRPALLHSVSCSDHFVQAIALQYRSSKGPDLDAAYIGKDNFLVHLIRLSRRDETKLYLTFTPVFLAGTMTRADIAQLTSEHIQQVIAAKASGETIPVQQVA